MHCVFFFLNDRYTSFMFPERCSGSSTAAQYDSRGRRCSCQNGVLVRCSRVRKEWHSLTPDERKRYINTVVTASRTYRICFSYLINLHHLLFTGYEIHGGPNTFFLPWHRWYILQVENLLRQISPGITIPYWDWSLEANTWTQSEVWDPTNGFGGNGIPVTTGPFKAGGSYIPPDPNKPIGRRFNGRPRNCAYIALIVQINDASQYSAWHRGIEVDLHDDMHCNIGATMCTSRSADDPIFFLHHGFIDKLWADWQNKGPQYMNLAVWAQNNKVMPGGSTPRQVYNLLQQPQCVSVSIQQPDRPCQTASPAMQLRASGESSSYIQTCSQSMMSKDYSPLKLAGFISRPIPEPSEEAFKLFHTSPEDQAIAKAKVKLLNNYDRLLEVLSENGYSTNTPLVDQVRGSLDLTSVIYRTLYLQSRNNTKCEL